MHQKTKIGRNGGDSSKIYKLQWHLEWPAISHSVPCLFSRSDVISPPGIPVIFRTPWPFYVSGACFGLSEPFLAKMLEVTFHHLGVTFPGIRWLPWLPELFALDNCNFLSSAAFTPGLKETFISSCCMVIRIKVPLIHFFTMPSRIRCG